jgi:hypothetical protein
LKLKIKSESWRRPSRLAALEARTSDWNKLGFGADPEHVEVEPSEVVVAVAEAAALDAG